MKKSVSILTSLFLALLIGCAVSGCESKKAEITVSETVATAPFANIELIENSNYKKLEYIEKYRTLEAETSEESTDYDIFLKYYNGDFKTLCDSRFVLLNPNWGEELSPWESQQRYNILAEEIEEESVKNPVIIQSFNIYDKQLGNRSENDYTKPVEGNYPGSVKICMISVPAKFKRIKTISLEFGEWKNTERYVFTDYINMYSDGECIGTCYYDNSEISVEWFLNYFKNNLIFN